MPDSYVRHEELGFLCSIQNKETQGIIQLVWKPIKSTKIDGHLLVLTKSFVQGAGINYLIASDSMPATNNIVTWLRFWLPTCDFSQVTLVFTKPTFESERQPGTDRWLKPRKPDGKVHCWPAKPARPRALLLARRRK